MTIIKAAEATLHEVHGSRFTAYVAPSSGSAELCAWRVEVPAMARGIAHRVSREEVFAMLAGKLEITVNGIAHEAQAGDVVLVGVQSEVRVDNPHGEPATMWVTTSHGLTATMSDGTTMNPPWTL